MFTFTTCFVQFSLRASISTSSHRLKQNIPCNQVVPFSRIENTVALYPPRRIQFFQKGTWFFGRQFARFSQTLTKLASVLGIDRFYSRHSKLRLDLKIPKTASLSISIAISLNTRKDNFLTFQFENNTSCVLSIKMFKLYGLRFTITEFNNYQI